MRVPADEADLQTREWSAARTVTPPWPKRAHRGRRFVRPDVVELLVDRLRPGGWLRVATDDADDAEQALALLGSPPGAGRRRLAATAVAAARRLRGEAVATGRPVIDVRYTRSGLDSGAASPTAAAAHSSSPPTT